MVRNIRRGVRGRWVIFRVILVHMLVIQDDQSPLQNVSTLRDDTESSSDDSTQPPDVVLETKFLDHMDSIGTYAYL